jgi:hypothetical protein
VVLGARLKYEVVFWFAGVVPEVTRELKDECEEIARM